MDDTEQQVRAGAALLGLEINRKMHKAFRHHFYIQGPIRAVGFHTWKQALSIITDPAKVQRLLNK